MSGESAALAIQDPPYNFVAFESQPSSDFVSWCRGWVDNTWNHLDRDSALYVWMGADQRNQFQPLPEFLLLMRESGFSSRSLITVRNQRGYGTQQNWMAVRQELLFYTKGAPHFNVDAEYTEIPKTLKGYYKKIDGRLTENTERGRSDTIRAGNVWIDIQQVFYRMEENVNGCYAQKPLKAIERIIKASSCSGALVIDWFSHSGTTLVASEMLSRRAYVADIDPIFAEISIRRLEQFRGSGRKGWQNSNPFALEESAHADETAGSSGSQGTLWST